MKVTATALFFLSILVGASNSSAAVVTRTIPWDLATDGTLRTISSGFMEYFSWVALAPDNMIPAGDTVELHFVFQDCARLQLRDATIPDGVINERLSVTLETDLFVPANIGIDVEFLGVSGAIQNNPFSSTIFCTSLCPTYNEPDMTQSSFSFEEFVIRITPTVPVDVTSCTFFFQSDFVDIIGASPASDFPQVVPPNGVALEYSNALDEQVLTDSGNTTLEQHGPLDPGQILYTEPIDVASNLRPLDATDFFPGTESGSLITSQVDALAYGNDAYLGSLLQNDADLLFSITGDAATEEWALLREAADGTLSVEYRHADLVNGNVAGGLDDVDAAELWGEMGSFDANYFSLQVDAATGTSIYRSSAVGSVEFISHVDIRTAAEQLGYLGEPDDLDVDGLMVRNEGGDDCLDGDDIVLFSLRRTSNGYFDGGEIIVLRAGAPAGFLEHGGQTWDTAHDLLARLAELNGGDDPEGLPDVDALEAIASTGQVGVAPSVAPGRIRMGGARPNPFNPSTEIHFELTAAGRASLTVFDARGRRIASLLDEALPAGQHVVQWNGRADDGSAVASGAYYAQLRALGASSTTKLILTK